MSEPQGNHWNYPGCLSNVIRCVLDQSPVPDIVCLECGMPLTGSLQVSTHSVIVGTTQGLGAITLATFCADHIPKTPDENRLLVGEMYQFLALTTQPKEPWEA